jgi:hypothetical protein
LNFPRQSTGLAPSPAFSRTRKLSLAKIAALAALGALVMCSAAFGATNVIEYTYDAAGNAWVGYSPGRPLA